MGAQGDIFPTFVTANSVAALQKDLAAELEVVRAALQRCADAKTFQTTDPRWESFQSLKTRVAAFVAETPSWITTREQMNRGELLRKEVVGWHDTAKAMGCDAGPAPVLPAESSLPTFFAGAGASGLLILGLLLFLRK